MAPEDSNPILCTIIDENNPSLVERFFSKDVWRLSSEKRCVSSSHFPIGLQGPLSVVKTKWLKSNQFAICSTVAICTIVIFRAEVKWMAGIKDTSKKKPNCD
ncbi:hypothetical protein CEXT_140431 [Caerostris extrusa]|uniref:Uncharacterized protein n=1 Tax=Caerostris extrusa TaxID=172846 RepID=A0AAV4XL55_CAEEX|nr:hypothetical protein CEXT_140431 [Caerostris extrusa]